MSFDEMYDELVHAEFLAGAVNDPPRQGAHAAPKDPFSSSRLRTIALVTSGGLACAAVGAFLGGLGGQFAINPASAHAVTTSHSRTPLQAVSNTAFHAPAASSVQRASAPVTGFTGGSSDVAVTPTPVASTGTSTGTTSSGGTPPIVTPPTGGGSGGTPPSGGTSPTPPTGTTTPTNPLTPIVDQLTAGLSGAVTDLTATLNSVGSSLSAPVPELSDVITPFSGVVSGLTLGLSDLGTIVSSSGSPLPDSFGDAPSEAVLTSAAAGSPSALGLTAIPGAATAGSLTKGATGTGGTSGGSSGSSGADGLPSLPTGGGSPSLPTLPVSLPTGTVPNLPVPTSPTPPATGTGGSGSSGSGTPTCVSTPTLPSTGTGSSGGGLGVSLGPITVGVSVGGASSGASVCVTP